MSSKDHEGVPGGNFGELLHLQRNMTVWLLEECRGLITDDLHEEILRCYPEFRSLLNHLCRRSLHHGILKKRWGNAPSIQTYFIRYALNFLDQNVDFE
jgi:hypothetical protein